MKLYQNNNIRVKIQQYYRLMLCTFYSLFRRILLEKGGVLDKRRHLFAVYFYLIKYLKI